jgi:hypothetical protein
MFKRGPRPCQERGGSRQETLFNSCGTKSKKYERLIDERKEKKINKKLIKPQFKEFNKILNICGKDANGNPSGIKPNSIRGIKVLLVVIWLMGNKIAIKTENIYTYTPFV